MPVLQDMDLKKSAKPIYIAILLILLIGIPFRLFPFIWIVANMFKSSLEIFQFPPSFLPASFDFDKIVKTLSQYDIYRNFLNSMLICFGTIVIQVAISSLAAFSISKLKPKGAKYILLFFLATMMISNESIIVPLYIMMSDLPVIHVNLINSYLSVILALSIWGWSVYIFKTFFDSFPDSLMESARIDGAGNLTIFLRLIVPLSKPVFAVVIINIFRAVYNQFVFPLLLLPKEKYWPIMVRIYASSEGNASWNSIMVMLAFAIFPVVLFYMVFQKNIIQGIATTGLKE